MHAHDYQLKFAKTSNPCYSAKVIISEQPNKAKLRYHETTAAWNFFILRIAIVPPAARNGTQLRAI
jgi:hypothetical protein